MRRFFAFPLVRMVAILAIFIAIVFAFNVVHLHLNRAIEGWILLAILAAIVLAVERLAVRRGPSEIGLDPRNIGRDTLLGLALGTVLFSLVIVELIATHSYRVDGVQWTNAVLYAALWLLPGRGARRVAIPGRAFSVAR